MLYAHSLENKPEENWQTLEEHSNAVSVLASGFASEFNSSQWANVLGKLHDAGKSRQSFQDYLKRCNGIETESYSGNNHEHAIIGAKWCFDSLPRNCREIFAYCISGHHAGLPDWIGGTKPNGALSQRLNDGETVLQEKQVQEYLTRYTPSDVMKGLNMPFPGMRSVDVSYWIRMLFSCLTDADFLDTESVMNRKNHKYRSLYPELPELAEKFFAALDEKQKSAQDTAVNRIRAEIRSDCEAAAVKQPGIFSLTVPTGGGKTLSGTAFAFRHAIAHRKKRIIYVIPYTSIIEQTADVIGHFIGKENVLEHHSNFSPDEETLQSALACENWDAPVIVTTSVQFFESLYACTSGRCRKLHNIANSVVILDEVQLLPKHLIYPCTQMIRQLADHYGVTFVLSTATQPALELDNVREIIAPDRNLYRRLKRTDITFPPDLNSPSNWDDLADELAQYSQVLCIVNTRKDCRELYDKMPEGTIHLSASMCGEHRSKIIGIIREKLKNGESVRVISTQLVEAGVDFDFPVVYRAFSGLTSIVQAAGRCNREGRLTQKGKVTVFIPPHATPIGELQKSEDLLKNMLHNAEFSLESAEIFRIFDKKLTEKMNDTGKELFQRFLENNSKYLQFQFREADAAFQMIDNQISAPVIVRYQNNDDLLNDLRFAGPSRSIMRKLQRYSVNIPKYTLKKMLENGFVSEIHPGIYVQEVQELYSELFGLDLFRKELTVNDFIV